jgi:TonB family protein
MSFKLTKLAATAAVLALVGSQAFATEPVSPGKLDWLRKPTGEDMGHYYPEKARKTETSGRVIMDCDVTAGGLLSGCRVVDEWPADYGFGDAGLQLSRIFRLDPKTVDLNDPNRNRIVMPIIFTAPGKPPPPNGYLAGQNAVALTIGVKPGTRYARACATAQNPDQLCVVRNLAWKEQPWLAATLPALEGVDMDTGMTTLQCRVSAQSRLINCIAEGKPTPAAEKAMLAVADMLVAPERALDGAPIGEGPVIVPFDWSKITPLARSLKRP